jgi:hypothetical protein
MIKVRFVGGLDTERSYGDEHSAATAAKEFVERVYPATCVDVVVEGPTGKFRMTLCSRYEVITQSGEF